MRLLFDQNLSRRLKERLQDLYPDSLHVQDIGLESNPDINVWEYAASHNLIVVTKDSDFVELSARLGHPPKSHSAECRQCLDRKCGFLAAE